MIKICINTKLLKNCDGFSYVANVGQSANSVLDNKHMCTRSEFIELIGNFFFCIF
jgi:hypothetical protein